MCYPWTEGGERIMMRSATAKYCKSMCFYCNVLPMDGGRSEEEGRNSEGPMIGKRSVRTTGR
eukprot:1671192-Rhodomonas_salina.4